MRRIAVEETMGATYQTPLTNVAIASGPQSDVTRQLIERARELGPVIRQYEAEAERDRRLAKPVHEALRGAGLQRMLSPRSLGGFEIDPVMCAQVVEEIASHDSAAGWALQAPNVNEWWMCGLPDEGVDEIYGRDPSAPMAAAFHPPQRAVEVPGGFRVTGRAPLASSIHDCDWVVFSAFIMDGAEPRMTELGPVMIAAILRTSDVKIIDTWYTLGMRGTDSNDAAFEDVFVPAHRTFVLAPDYQRGSRFQGPLYRFPGASIVALFSTAVLLATARNAISELRELAAKKTPFGSMKTLRDRGTVQVALAESEANLRSARAYFYDTMSQTWARTEAGSGSTLEQRADLLLAAIHAVKSAVEVTDTMHRLAGTTAIYTRSRLDRYFRDAHTLRQHGFVSESKLESIGQIYLGLPPDFPLIAF
jgi:alkylation response protein AidB-like acyl-CoA dehydrogenase